jgi:hypothetical protein
MAESGDYGGYIAFEPEPPDHAGKDDDPLISLLVALALIGLVTICAGLAFYTFHLTRALEPRYSVQITGVQGFDPLQSSPSPAFNLTIHVDNKQHIRRVCKEESNVVVYYNEASDDGINETSIGWGRLPAFCVDRLSTRDLGLSLSNQGVFLSQRLREKMERDRQSRGMKMAVEIKPVHPEEASRACIVMCDGKLGQSVAAAPAMPCLQLCATERKFIYYKTQRRPIFLLHTSSPF